MQNSSGSATDVDLLTLKTIHSAAPTYTMVHITSVLTAIRTSRPERSETVGFKVGEDGAEGGSRLSLSWLSESR